MRAILKLIAVGSVIAVFGIADSIEAPAEALYAAGGGLLLLLPFVIQRIDRRAATATAPAAEACGRAKFEKAATTLDVIPLPRPQTAMEDDIEGKTVRAPMSHEEAYEMHARYAPYFDQQLAIARYQAEHGEDVEADVLPDHEAVPQPVFDQHRYAQALQYADAFEEQLTARRRTAAYEVAPPRRMARGSYTPQQYRAADTRSDRRPSNSNDWESKTLIGVRPVKRGK